MVTSAWLPSEAGRRGPEERDALGPASLGLRSSNLFSKAEPLPGGTAPEAGWYQGATLDDLDLDLALVSLTTYCEQLRRAPLTRDALLPLIREQGLLRNARDDDEVTYGAILLFGKNTQQFVPQAVVTVTERGKKREVYDGNLLSQRLRLLEQIESTDFNPVVKLKKRRSHEDQPAYQQPALVELLVNLLVHRDYEVEWSANIDIQPGTQIAFKNPGGLTPKMAKLVSVGSDGKIGIAAGATDPRNVSPVTYSLGFGLWNGREQVSWM